MKKVPHYDPTNDLVFKFVFGRDERKNVTLAFINDMTGREGRDAFVDLDFRTSELVPDKLDDKLGRLDIFGILDNAGSHTSRIAWTTKERRNSPCRIRKLPRQWKHLTAL
ncbi:PD-(D/E)XK nuclease family transposase [uncultured Selenomonas sp.]|uniref:PD-(D/E)XK nuclease family transposase n=1 Tax=uncultured Selenomonas sp. TaxID=159275 RepID=UPI003459E898